MKISERVENILKISQAARDSDKKLLIIYMQKSGMNLSEDQVETFLKMPSMETIRRERQKFHEKGLYPASQSVGKERFERFIQVKYNINELSPEELLETQGYKVVPYGEG